MNGRQIIILLTCLIIHFLVFSAILGFAAGGNSIYLPFVSGSTGKKILAPELKWQHGGCYPSWCETGWYSSPAVADLNNDGGMEIIASAYSVVVLDGKTGALEWRVPSGHDRSQPEASNVGRTWPGIVVEDLNADGQLEIVTAHGGEYLAVYNRNGYFEPGWPVQATGGLELRGLAVSDLDKDGDLENIATGAVYGKVNTWVYEHIGKLRSGWPQLSNDSGYAYGVFNDNAAVGDLDGDGYGELVIPSDVHYICAYERDGIQIPAADLYDGKGWGKIGVWESPEIELRGWGTCEQNADRSERFRANFAHGPAVIADVDRNGRREVIATGNVYDCAYGDYPSRYIGVYIFNTDRSRFAQSGFDWKMAPIDTGAPLSEDYNQIENAQANPAVADLDGDGLLEILFASYDGRMHAFWLDETEHGNWPYQVYDPGEGFLRFASEPAIVDLDQDGRAEVIFTSWVEKGTGETGRLYLLDYQGNPLYVVDLPPAFRGDWNGALAAPTLANIDTDPDLEVVLNTAHSGIIAYDLTGTSQGRILWGTGRGNFRRDGYLP